jgi:hypothetical protein
VFAPEMANACPVDSRMSASEDRAFDMESALAVVFVLAVTRSVSLRTK